MHKNPTQFYIFSLDLLGFIKVLNRNMFKNLTKLTINSVRHITAAIKLCLAMSAGLDPNHQFG